MLQNIKERLKASPSSSSSSHTRRQQFHIHQKAIVLKNTNLSGEIHIGAGTVIHPHATVRAISGPIYIKECNIIEEYAEIINLSGSPLYIGSFNIFEVGSVTAAKQIGDSNKIECKAQLGKNCIIGDHCVVGTKTSVDDNDEIISNTVIFGENRQRSKQFTSLEEHNKTMKDHIQFLTQTLPMYNFPRGPSK
eukprot:gb/GECH01001991.1/.p1 GENE.gb/GECH01001991.1/~~gb/GECH01001991.1/.p1  ORF type:complete len:192 (+),score=47.55 gb/GECH01001991.1/:1-576(+)